MYYTESEEIQIGRVRHRWAATYILFSFYLARKTPPFMENKLKQNFKEKDYEKDF